MSESRETVHSTLRGDVAVVRDYGNQRPHEWVDVWFENDPTVRLVTAFSDNVAVHEAELRRLVAHPEWLDVRFLPWSRDARQRILDQVQQLAADRSPGTLCGWGLGTGQVTLTLSPDAESFAAALFERFGEALVLTVGVLPYPSERPPSTHEARRPAATVPEYITIEGLETELVLSTPRLLPGENGQGQLVVRNVGSGPIIRSTGQPVAGRILDRESGRVVGGGYRPMRGTGKAIRLEPGGRDTIAVSFGTASYDSALGYALAPGRYHVEVELVVRPAPGAGGTGGNRSREVVKVPPAELTIVATRAGD